MKLKKFALILLIIAIVVLGCLIYPILKNRFFSSSSNSRETNIEQTKNQESTANNENQSSSEKTSSSDSSDPTPPTDSKTESVSIDVNNRNKIDGKELANITNEHCNSDCEAFANNFEYLEYCQQVCGIAPIKTVTTCDDKKDLQKDYCLKDLAVSKKDVAICKQITDANIELTCKNRITQDILEGN